jgi:hypothetical protein
LLHYGDCLGFLCQSYGCEDREGGACSVLFAVRLKERKEKERKKKKKMHVKK